jgi:hypothetical protein
MRRFTDATGRAWDLAIHVDAIDRVLAACEIDLLALLEGDDPPLARLTTDDRLFTKVVWTLVEESAGDLDETGFRRLMDGPTLAAAFDAFWEELADFFQSRGRNAVAAAINAQLTALTKTHEAVTKAMTTNGLAARVAETARKNVERDLVRLFGDSPDSSASIPAG